MSDVAIRGGTLRTRVDGDGDKPWLVLSNSFATDHGMWDGEIARLVATRRVLRYDTRGHGGSTAPPAPYAFDDLVGDVVAAMDAHGIGHAAFMGVSLGGMTGLGMALAHPERVERLVCCAARADNPEPFRRSWDDRLAIVNREGTQGIVASTIERWLTSRTRAERPDDAAQLAAMIRRTSTEGYRGCAAALKTLNYLEDLGRLAVPTLYIGGSDDNAIPVPVMQAMADRTPGGRLAVVADAAHIVNVDNPEGFAAAVGDFLA